MARDGWIDFCDVIWVMMDEATFDRDFDVDDQSLAFRASFAALKVVDEGP